MDSGGARRPGLASGYYSLSKQGNPRSEEALKNIVLVHGGFVDGSGWQGVYDLLTADGYSVKVVQNPTVSLASDVAATKIAIAGCEGPVVLVGHSYGGVVPGPDNSNAPVVLGIAAAIIAAAAALFAVSHKRKATRNQA
jgi:pimeloyl-ACP methyl ester carboxylesterase